MDLNHARSLSWSLPLYLLYVQARPFSHNNFIRTYLYVCVLQVGPRLWTVHYCTCNADTEREREIMSILIDREMSCHFLKCCMNMHAWLTMMMGLLAFLFRSEVPIDKKNPSAENYHQFYMNSKFLGSVI